MPFYTVTAPENSIIAERKHALAKAITRVHAEITGAPESFVHVSYLDMSPEDWYAGGEPTRHVRVDGRIRAGRSDAVKQGLIRQISTVTAQITGLDLGLIGVGVTEIAARYNIEGGRIVPEPGREAVWMKQQAPAS